MQKANYRLMYNNITATLWLYGNSTTGYITVILLLYNCYITF